MKNSNFDYQILEDLVGTQYGDMTGLIQIDGHDNVSGLYDLMKQNGIDENDYFLLGFGLADFTLTGVGECGKVSCTVLLLDKNKYGQNFDEIKEQIIANPKVSVIKKTFYIDYVELGEYIKRFDALMLTPLGDYINEIKITEE